jgi:hypothetical protein
MEFEDVTMVYFLWGCPKGSIRPVRVDGVFPTHQSAIQRKSELAAVGWSGFEIEKHLEGAGKGRQIARPPKVRSRSKTRGR